MSFWTKIGKVQLKSFVPFVWGILTGYALNMWVKTTITFDQLRALIQTIIDGFKN